MIPASLSTPRWAGVPLLAAAVVLVAVALAAVTLPVAGYEFLRWDDPRTLEFVAARDAGFPSRLDWLFDPGLTGMRSPVAVATWGILADTVGMTPRACHLLVLLLHALNVGLVAATCRALLRHAGPSDGPPGDAAAWTAAACAAGLWGLHPVRAEAVAWVAAMPHLLATALGLASLLAFLPSLTALGKRREALLAASGALYLLATLAHPHVIPLCVVMLLLQWRHQAAGQASGSDPWWRVHGPARWFHVATSGVALWAAAMGLGLRSGAAVAPSPLPPDAVTPAYLALQLVKYLGFAGDFSLLHAWLPRRTVLIPPEYDSSTWLWPTFLAGLAVLLVLAVLAWRRARVGAPGLLVALLAHLAYAVPASGPFLQQYVRGDRYLYGITVIGAAVAAWLLLEQLRRWQEAPWLRALAVAGALAVDGAAASALSGSLEKWRGTVPLMEDLIATGPALHWRLFAGVRLVHHFEALGDRAAAHAALLRLVELPAGTEEERLVKAVSHMAYAGYCGESERLIDERGGVLPRAQAERLRGFVWRCRHER